MSSLSQNKPYSSAAGSFESFSGFDEKKCVDLVYEIYGMSISNFSCQCFLKWHECIQHIVP